MKYFHKQAWGQKSVSTEERIYMNNTAAVGFNLKDTKHHRCFWSGRDERVGISEGKCGKKRKRKKSKTQLWTLP